MRNVTHTHTYIFECIVCSILLHSYECTKLLKKSLLIGFCESLVKLCVLALDYWKME